MPADSQSAARRADYYDDPAYNYLQYWAGREYEHAAEEIAIRRLLGNQHFRHAVDVGGGYGRLTALLVPYADKVTLVDPSHQQLELAATHLKDYPAVERQLAQAANLAFSDGSIDLLLCIRIMHHLPDPTPEFREISRVLSGNGYAIIEVANSAHIRNRLKHLRRGAALPRTPINRRTAAGHLGDETPFVNHHPKTVIHQLEQAGLGVEAALSVSNLRSALLKKYVPHKLMLSIEQGVQRPLASAYFGPSIFFLVRKTAS